MTFSKIITTFSILGALIVLSGCAGETSDTAEYSQPTSTATDTSTPKPSVPKSTESSKPKESKGALLNASSPTSPIKLIFIHHSTGENWLADDYGDLGKALDKNNYFVSDTNYEWGPKDIGDRTDIPDWLEWFSSKNTEGYMTALFAESGQNSDYTRTLSAPGGENEIVMFKSCFPNSELEGNPTDPATAGEDFTVGNAKYVYNEILKYFSTKPDKLFVVITAPPVSDKEYSANARAFNKWLVNDWLSENNYTKNNVAIFDFYNVLTGPNNHHRYQNGAVEYVTGKHADTLYYPSDDDHPSEIGSKKATTEFVPMLNIFVNCWKGTGGCN